MCEEECQEKEEHDVFGDACEMSVQAKSSVKDGHEGYRDSGLKLTDTGALQQVVEMFTVSSEWRLPFADSADHHGKRVD